MSSRPVAITISPVGKILPRGVLHARMEVHVANTGTQPVDVIVSKTAITGSAHGCATVNPPSWMTVTPGRMHLSPGQSRVAVMRVSAPKTASGTYDLVAVFAASPGKGQVRITASAGAQMVIHATGREVIPSCGHHVKAAVPPQPPGAGLLIPSLAGGAALVLAVIAVVIVRWRRRFR